MQKMRHYVSFHFENDPDNMNAQGPPSGVAGMILDLDIPIDTDEAVARLTMVLMQNFQFAHVVLLGVIPLKMPLVVKPPPMPILGPHGNVVGQARPEGLI